MTRLKAAWCRVFAHRVWFVNDPRRPLDITTGCTRCKNPATFSTLTTVDEDPQRPGYVRVRGFDRLGGFLEGKR